jgi:hypothetical protein
MRLTQLFDIASTSAISVTEVRTPASSGFCHHQAREGLDQGAIGPPLVARHEFIAIGRDDALTDAAALAAHGDVRDEYGEWSLPADQQLIMQGRARAF